MKEIGRRRWKKESGYPRQARVENVFFRYKSIIGDRRQMKIMGVAEPLPRSNSCTNALRWSDVDLELGSAEITRSFSSGVRLGPTKTGRSRVVELSRRLIHVLSRAQPNVFPIPEQALVFPNQSGGMLQAMNFRARVFRKVIREAIGARASFSPHCLRHTWASLHLSRGTPIKWVQVQGGWTTAKVLLDTYGHFMPAEMRGFADALATPNGPPRGLGPFCRWRERSTQPGNRPVRVGLPR